MSDAESTDNAFSSRDFPTLEWVRDKIASSYEIPHHARMDMVSACNSASSWFDLPLSMIPASAEFFRQKFKNIHHLQAGVSERRFNNVKSLLPRSLRQVGLSTKLLPYHSEMNADWRAL